jgi:hypothetical protein
MTEPAGKVFSDEGGVGRLLGLGTVAIPLRVRLKHSGSSGANFHSDRSGFSLGVRWMVRGLHPPLSAIITPLAAWSNVRRRERSHSWCGYNVCAGWRCSEGGPQSVRSSEAPSPAAEPRPLPETGRGDYWRFAIAQEIAEQKRKPNKHLAPLLRGEVAALRRG